MPNPSFAKAQRLHFILPAVLLLSALASCGKQEAPQGMPPIEVGVIEVKQ